MTSRLKKTAACFITTGIIASSCFARGQKSDLSAHTIKTFAGPLEAGSPAQNQKALPDLTERSELTDYLVYAALNNAGLEAAFNRWKAALERIGQVTALPDPRFEYRYFIEEVETRVGPQRQSFGISQIFPWFGKLELAGDVAAEAANAARQRYEAVKLKLFFEVKDAYYEYYYLAKSIAVTKENIALVKHLETVARSRYKAAAATHSDVIRAQVEIGKLEDRYRALLDFVRPVSARLNAALNRPVDSSVPWPKEIRIEQVQLADEQLLAELVAKNPELKALDFEITQSQHKIDLAEKDYYPDFTVGVSLIDTDNSPVGSPRDNGKDPVIAMVSVNVPLWRDKYDARVQEARNRYFAATRQRTEKANSLSVRLKMALYRFRDAERKLDLYRNALLPKAAESVKVTESDFRAAKAGFADLIDAQRILLEFGLSYERAVADRAQGLAELEMLIGRAIASTGNKSGHSSVLNQ